MKNFILIVVVSLGLLSTFAYTSFKKDKCETSNVVCVNNGVCKDGTCTCPLGFEGATCYTKSVDKFVGSFFGPETCNGGSSSNTTVNISSGFTEIDLVIMIGSQSIPATLTSPNSFNISYSSGSSSYTGTGSISGKTLSIHLVSTDWSGTNTCDFSLTKF